MVKGFKYKYIGYISQKVYKSCVSYKNLAYYKGQYTNRTNYINYIGYKNQAYSKDWTG